MRLIDADGLTKKVYVWTEDEWNSELLPYWVKDDLEDMIESAPTVDAEPVKHGHWIDDWDIGCSVCSECDDSFLWEDFNGVREFNYCPTCGCKMDEVTE